MSYRLIVRPDAEADLEEACLWYEEQRAGLGNELLKCVETALQAIEERPLAYPTVHDPIRRVLVRRFPFAVYYVLEEDSIFVLSIVHVSRDPKRWQRRFSDDG